MERDHGFIQRPKANVAMTGSYNSSSDPVVRMLNYQQWLKLLKK